MKNLIKNSRLNPRKIFFSTIIVPLWLFSFDSFSQQSQSYLVLENQDTLYGTVEYINEEGFGSRDFYKKIRITDAEGKGKKYKRKKVVAFSIKGQLYESYWLRQESSSFPKITLVNPEYIIDAKKGDQYFLKLIEKGKLSHYELEWFEQGNSTLWSMALLKKEGNSFLVRADQGLFGLKKKVLQQYFSACPTLSSAIEKEELKKVSEVVSFYNKHCFD